jgi:hypothetical protein
MCTPLQVVEYLTAKGVGTDEIRIDILAENTSSNYLCFAGIDPPPVTLVAYLERIVRYASIEPPCLVCALIYIKRMISKASTFLIGKHSLHRLLAATILCAHKMNSDNHQGMSRVSEILGMPPNEIASLEEIVLKRLDYRLLITLTEYTTFLNEINEISKLVHNE